MLFGLIEWPQLALFMTASLALNLTPGPDMLFVAASSMRNGTRSGAAAALGVGAGAFVHIFAAVLGLSAIVMTSALAFEVLRWAGAAYLLWLAVKAFRSTGGLEGGKAVRARSHWASFRHGAVTNILNPKVAIFFLAFLPQFVSPTSNVIAQTLLLGVLMNISGTAVNLAVAVAGGGLAGQLKRNPSISRVMNWFCGTVFGLLAVKLLLAERRAV